MGITKEEAKKLIISAVKSDIVIKHLSGDATFIDATEALKKIFSALYQLELDHPKVKLPRDVGEELDEWMFDNKDRLVGRIGELIFDMMTHEPKLTNVFCFVGDSEENCLKVIDAYRYGWTAEKSKRYVLPMPGTEYHNIQMHGNAQYYAIKGNGNWRPDAIALGTDDAVKHGYTVTQSEIDTAPDWVKAIKPFEVTEDDD